MPLQETFTQKEVRDPRNLEKILEAQSAAVNDIASPYTVTVTGSDQEDGTNDVTLQVKNSAGDNVAARCVLRVWVAGSAYAAPSATGITAFAVGTGVELDEETNLADYRILTDATGLAVFTLTAADGTYHVMAECAGVASTGTAVVTGN
jgi:hypothetical protein